MSETPTPTCGHCDGPHSHNECPAVARMLVAEAAAETAPSWCYACQAPRVWGTDCRYCQRYNRPCGRHDTDHTH